MIIDSETESCIKDPRIGSARRGQWIPSRNVWSPINMSPSGHYELKHSNFPNICNGNGFYRNSDYPEIFLTNGTVLLQNQEPLKYACADNILYVDTNSSLYVDVDNAAALICATTPKCCDENEYFCRIAKKCVRMKEQNLDNSTRYTRLNKKPSCSSHRILDEFDWLEDIRRIDRDSQYFCVDNHFNPSEDNYEKQIMICNDLYKGRLKKAK